MEPRKLRREDFQFITTLGRGSYGRVVKAQLMSSGEIYAIKVVEKAFLEREKKEQSAEIEKKIQEKLRDCAGVVKLHSFFEDRENLYYVLEYCPHGDLGSLIKTFQMMPWNLVQYYTAELVSTLEFMHSKGIAHRDLKPENILIGPNYHLKISDFGAALDMNESHEYDKAFVGTAQYVAPEMLNGDNSQQPADIWALGCILFEMITGQSPFTGSTNYLIFEKIRRLELDIPDMFPDDARELVARLLVINPRRRLGICPNSWRELKNHAIFRRINFNRVFVDPVPFGFLPEIKTTVIEDDHDLEELNRKDFKILLSGVVKKKSGILGKTKMGVFYSKRVLTLTSQPKLFYSDTDSVYKGEVLLSAQVRAEKGTGKEFFIHTPGRVYYFKGPHEWVERINSLIKSSF